MASAHAKFTGGVGLCYATSGARGDPSADRPLRREGRPRAGSWRSSASRRAPRLVPTINRKSISTASSRTLPAITSIRRPCPARCVTLIDRAVRIASAKRVVTCVILPNDLQELPYEDPPLKHGTTHTGIGYALPAQTPDATALRASCRRAERREEGWLSSSGAGALGATDEVIAVADKLQAGIAKALLGKAVVPDDLPFVTGSSRGCSGTKPSWDLMQACDTLFMIGVGLSLQRVSCRRPARRAACRSISTVGGSACAIRWRSTWVGDSATALRALLPMLQPKPAGKWACDYRRQCRALVDAARRARALIAAEPINPPTHLLGIVEASAGRCDHDGRFRHRRELVCPGHQDPPRHDGIAVGRSCLARRRNALRHRGEDGVSGASGHRLHWRRRHADELA